MANLFFVQISKAIPASFQTQEWMSCTSKTTRLFLAGFKDSEMIESGNVNKP
jgi:hypothetical protein